MIPREIKMKKVSVSIPKELWEQADDYVNAGTSRSMSALVTKALHRYLEEGRN
jgi:metal-responsive CopG/Arc/MetJ family transcriptional regulator